MDHVSAINTRTDRENYYKIEDKTHNEKMRNMQQKYTSLVYAQPQISFELQLHQYYEKSV